MGDAAGRVQIRELDDSRLEQAVRLWESDAEGDTESAVLARRGACRRRGAAAGARAATIGEVNRRRCRGPGWRASAPGCSAGRSRQSPAGEASAPICSGRSSADCRRLACARSRCSPRTARAAVWRRRRPVRRSYQEVLYLEKRRLHATVADDRLEELGGAWPLEAELWPAIGRRGRDESAARVDPPLAEQDAPRRHRVVAASAVILFGPPGTGKTTFREGDHRPPRLGVRRDVPEPARGLRRPWPCRCPARPLRTHRVPRPRRRLHRRGGGDRRPPPGTAGDPRYGERAAEADTDLPRRRLTPAGGARPTPCATSTTRSAAGPVRLPPPRRAARPDRPRWGSGSATSPGSRIPTSTSASRRALDSSSPQPTSSSPQEGRPDRLRAIAGTRAHARDDGRLRRRNRRGATVDHGRDGARVRRGHRPLRAVLSEFRCR